MHTTAGNFSLALSGLEAYFRGLIFIVCPEHVIIVAYTVRLSWVNLALHTENSKNETQRTKISRYYELLHVGTFIMIGLENHGFQFMATVALLRLTCALQSEINTLTSCVVPMCSAITEYLRTRKINSYNLCQLAAG